MLAAIKTDKGDGLTVPTPKLYYLKEQREIPEFSADNPIIEVTSGGAMFKKREMGGSMGNRNFDLDLRMILACMNSNETTLVSHVLRCSRAITKILWDKNLNGMRAVGGTVLRESRDRPEVIPADAGGYQQFTKLNFTIDYWEGF